MLSFILKKSTYYFKIDQEYKYCLLYMTNDIFQLLVYYVTIMERTYFIRLLQREAQASAINQTRGK